MRIAICLYGLVGNIVGKSGDTSIGAEKVMRLSQKHLKKYILNRNPSDQIDIFIHSWNTELQEQIRQTFKPIKAEFEKQKKFKIPEYVVGEEQRKQNHYSRWYTTQKVVKMKSDYEARNRFTYDFVMISRFDVAWRKPIIFSELNSSKFYAGGWYRKNNSKLKDFWFISNSETMNKFGNLYDKLNTYNKPGECGMNKKLGISNHKLSKYHLDSLGIEPSYFLYCEDDFDPELSDYPLIRYMYYRAEK